MSLSFFSPPLSSRQIPRELLLILKTNDNLRQVDLALGAPINTLLITARYSQRAISSERAETAARSGSSLWSFPFWTVTAQNLVEETAMELSISIIPWITKLLEYLYKNGLLK
jgi:hypothetical protein